MSTTFKLTLAAAVLAATPVLAGNLTFDNGQTTWHSTECTAPTPPASVLGVSPETGGDDMNALITQHNAYVDAAQNYMNCISQESSRDQSAVDQSIVNSAQAQIAQVQSTIDKDAAMLKAKQK